MKMPGMLDEMAGSVKRGAGWAGDQAATAGLGAMSMGKAMPPEMVYGTAAGAGGAAAGAGAMAMMGDGDEGGGGVAQLMAELEDPTVTPERKREIIAMIEQMRAQEAQDPLGAGGDPMMGMGGAPQM